MGKLVTDLLQDRARELGSGEALRFKRDGRWLSHSWEDYRDLTLRAARAMLAHGLEAGRGVAIMGFNRPEWFFANLGAVAAGARPTGVYTNLTPEQVAYIADHSSSQLAVAENREYLEKFLAVRDELPGLETLVLWDGEVTPEEAAAGVLTWRDFMAAGEEDDALQARLDERISAQDPDDVCELIYTSGTTGPPKGVMLSHRNLVWTATTVGEGFDLGQGHRVISYLPLSHSAEQMVSLYIPLVRGMTTCFAESLELMADNLKEIRPHVFFGVPRVWEKMQAAIQQAGQANPPLKKKIAAWAREVGLAAGYAEQGRGSKPLLHPLAEKLVFDKVRQRIGLDEALICATGAAPMAQDTADFFLSLGIPVLNFYGLSETSAPATQSVPGHYRTGRAGVPLPGTDVVIADDGEVLIRGPHVFKGYHRDPEATAEVMDDEGFFHSGDVGRIDDEGFLQITDRKKELIITSGGKNIAPQVLENELKRIPAVEHAVVVGDGRKYLAALFTLEPEAARVAAEEAGSPETEPAALAACPVFRAWMEARVEEVNQGLARYETMKTFHVLPGAFTVEGGELTPTMKLKRRVINEKYGDEIEGLYPE